MKKNMIPAGALLLAMACGSGADNFERKPATALEESRNEDAPAPPEPPAAPDTVGYTTDLDGALANASYYTTTLALADQNGQVSSGILDGSASRFANNARPKPDVGAAISSSAAVQGTDTAHRFLRSADLRFRVKDVVEATLGIEDIVGAHGGWVTQTRLRSESRGMNVIPVSEDSVLEVARYELVNTITLRVPNRQLDSTLRRIGRWVDQFDHRTILADDIRLRMMANAMAVRRAKAHSQRVANAIDDHGRKLKETLSAEEALQASDERRDQGILNNLELADRVAFSTVTLDIYQRTLVRREMIANERNIEAYRPSLWSRIMGSLKDGWAMVEMAITGLVAIWPILLLLGGALWLLWRNRRKSQAMPRHMPPPAPPMA